MRIGLLAVAIFGIVAFFVATRPPLGQERAAFPPSAPMSADDNRQASALTGRTQDRGRPAVMPGLEPNLASNAARSAFRRENRAAVTGAALALLAELSERASKGDARAAYDLWQLLHECARVNKLLGAAGTVKTLVRDCDQVPADEIAARLAWLEQSAEAGDVEAQLAYGVIAGLDYADPRVIARDIRAFEAYRIKAVRYLTAAAAAGNGDAMVQLAEVYGEGTMVPKDLVLQYAYAHAAARTGLFHGAPAAAARLEATLAPHQIAAGRAFAEQLLLRCCS